MQRNGAGYLGANGHTTGRFTAERAKGRLFAPLRGLVAALLALSVIGGFLVALAAPAAAQSSSSTEAFTLTSAAVPGKGTVTTQGNPTTLPDPIALHGALDSATGAISNGNLTIPTWSAEEQGQHVTFALNELNPGTATGTYDATTGAMTLQDTFRFNVSVLTYSCASSPINVALSGTYDATSQQVTLATTSSFTIPQFPDAASAGSCLSVISNGLNAGGGKGIAGSTGNALSITLQGKFEAGQPTTTTLAASPSSPQAAGTKVTLTATVAPTSGTGSTPSGNVTFYANGADLGSAALASGTATFATTDLPQANNQLTAVYAGDATYATSTSAAVAYAIEPAPSLSIAGLPSALNLNPSGAMTPSFEVTLTNPAGGQNYPDVWLNIRTGSPTVQPGANNGPLLEYQDAAGNWCPVDDTATYNDPNPYFSGPGSPPCGTPPPASMSLPAGSSLTIHMKLGYPKQPDPWRPGSVNLQMTLTAGTCQWITNSPPPYLQCSSKGALANAAGTMLLNPASRTTPVLAPQNGCPSTLTVLASFPIYPCLQVEPPAGSGLQRATDGTVTSVLDGKVLGSAPLEGLRGANGLAPTTYPSAGLSPGDHTLVLQWSGDNVYSAASLTQTVVVQPAPPGALYSCVGGGAPYPGYVNVQAVVPSSVPSGTSVPLTHADLTLIASGGANFTNSDWTASLTPSGSLKAASASVTRDRTNNSGTYTLTSSTSIKVSGDPGTSVPIAVQQVTFTGGSGIFATPNTCTPMDPAQLTTIATPIISGNALSVSPSGAANVGTPVTLTDQVSPVPGAGTPGGQVTFYDGKTLLATVPVNNLGQAKFTTNLLAAGDHVLTARWDGAGLVSPNTSKPVDLFVGNPTTTTLAASAKSPSNAAHPVTFTATVSPPQGATAMPKGTVSFTEDAKPVASCTKVPLGSDTPPTATCQLSFGAGESHALVAIYNGDKTYVPSTSKTLTQATSPGAKIALASSENPAVAGPQARNVLLWAVLSPDSGATAPGGTVDFLVRGHPRCTGVDLMADGSLSWAICVTKFTSPGISAPVTVSYSGDANFSGSTSSTFRQLTMPETTTKLYNSPNPARAGQQVTLTAEVRPSSGQGQMPQGVVTFVVDKKVYQPCKAVALGGGGRARCTLSLPAGTHYAHAVYLGGNGYSSSESQVVTQHVNASAKHRR